MRIYAGLDDTKEAARKGLAKELPLDYEASADNRVAMALLLSEWETCRTHPEDPILKKINLTIDPKNFSILLKMVKLEASEINIMFNIILIMILINIDQY